MSQDYAFVIMPFTPEMDEVYNVVIKPAVEHDHRLSCRLAAEISPSIIRGIVEGIRDAEVVIADLTGKNANVFYELGIAHALGNNVIMLSQEVDQIPFNVRPYKVIPYSRTLTGAKALGQELRQEIATLREWSARPTNPVQDFFAQSPPSDRRRDLLSLEAELRARTEQLEQVRLAAVATQAELEQAQKVAATAQRELERRAALEPLSLAAAAAPEPEPRIIMRPVTPARPEERIRFRKAGTTAV